MDTGGLPSFHARFVRKYLRHFATTPLLATHLEITKTYHHIRNHFFWSGLFNSVAKNVLSCAPRQRCKQADFTFFWLVTTDTMSRLTFLIVRMDLVRLLLERREHIEGSLQCSKISRSMQRPLPCAPALPQTWRPSSSKTLSFVMVPPAS